MYPVSFTIERPSNMSRAQVFLRLLILILASWMIGSGGWFGLVYLGLPVVAAILIARKGGRRYLDEDGDRMTNSVRFLVGVLAYLAYLTDDLPGGGRSAVQFDVVRSGSPTLGSALMRIVRAIPSCLVLAVLSVVSTIVSLIAAISILLMERYPARLWDFQRGVVAWQSRLLAYLASLVEPYPPFAWSVPSAPLPV